MDFANPLLTMPGVVTITRGIDGLACCATSAEGGEGTTTTSRSIFTRSAVTPVPDGERSEYLASIRRF
jgi:hypothetical protein